MTPTDMRFRTGSGRIYPGYKEILLGGFWPVQVESLTVVVMSLRVIPRKTSGTPGYGGSTRGSAIIF